MRVAQRQECAEHTGPVPLPAGAPARAWWQYALRAVRYLARTRGLSWEALRRVCELRKLYVPHYTACLVKSAAAAGGSRAAGVGGDAVIAGMDAQLDEATILVFRWGWGGCRGGGAGGAQGLALAAPLAHGEDMPARCYACPHYAHALPPCLPCPAGAWPTRAPAPSPPPLPQPPLRPLPALPHHPGPPGWAGAAPPQRLVAQQQQQAAQRRVARPGARGAAAL